MPVHCICQQCSAEFSVPPAVVRRGAGKFCSQACYDQARYAKVTLVCQHCGSPYETFRSRVDAGYGKYCSRDCHNAAMRKFALATCQNCGKDFYPTKDGRKYCSQRCHGEARIIPIEDRTWDKIDKTSSPFGCWLWLAAKDPHGYGLVSVNQGCEFAHRVVFELVNGPFDKSLQVLHNCPGGDNPSCVNPAHLYLGTNADNRRDAAIKNQHHRKLTLEQVREIKRRIATGPIDQTRTAAEFGVHQRVIYDIVHGNKHRYTT